jgi:hypothetical protein
MDAVEVLRTVLQIPLGNECSRVYNANARRVGTANREEFDTLVLLECAQEQEKGSLREEDVIRVIDRVRHRIIRRLRHRAVTLPSPEQVEARPSSPPTEAAAFLEACHRELKEWKPNLLALFELYLGGLSGRQIAAELGISTPTVSRKLHEIRKFLSQRLDDPRG